MPELIDADYVMTVLKRVASNYSPIGILKEAEDYAVPANIPLDESIFKAIDIVPVVRCKDCRWVYYESADVRCCTLHKGLAMISPDSFCSYGKRRGHNATD